MKNDDRKKQTAIILGCAIVAAAWLIVGPDQLSKRGIEGTANDLLVWFPAMALYFGSLGSSKQTLACEARAFKRLFRK